MKEAFLKYQHLIMTIKKVFGKLHLWFGLATGSVVFVICIPAAIWAFSPELENLTQRYRHVKIESNPFLSVNDLRAIAEKQLPGKKANRINLEGKEKAAMVDFYGEGYYYTAFINPYNGQLLKFKNNENDFFRIVITGHYTLWLGKVGGQIVKWSTLIFLVMLVSGIILWWPKNKAARKQRFKIKFGTSTKRLNYDLHNVLGFYGSWIVLFAVLTGLVWTFDSLSKTEYWLASGGKNMAEYPNPIAKKTMNAVAKSNGIDSLFNRHLQQYNNPYAAIISFPSNDSAAYSISIYPKQRYYDSDTYFYNQHTLQAIPVAAYGLYANANGGEKLSRMNYDIHIGNIVGLPGRVAMFLAVLIGASLPVTGFYMWWGKRRKNKKAAKEKANKILSASFNQKKHSTRNESVKGVYIF